MYFKNVFISKSFFFVLSDKLQPGTASPVPMELETFLPSQDVILESKAGADLREIMKKWLQKLN